MGLKDIVCVKMDISHLLTQVKRVADVQSKITYTLNVDASRYRGRLKLTYYDQIDYILPEDHPKRLNEYETNLFV